jgi:hypothetical protein
MGNTDEAIFWTIVLFVPFWVINTWIFGDKIIGLLLTVIVMLATNLWEAHS